MAGHIDKDREDQSLPGGFSDHCVESGWGSTYCGSNVRNNQTSTIRCFLTRRAIAPVFWGLFVGIFVTASILVNIPTC